MKIDVFDVAHGQCVCVTTPNGRRILIDCGHRLNPNWWPSVHYAGHNVDLLIVTNIDEDHLSDFEDLQQGCASPTLIVTNRSVSSDVLRAMKPDGMGRGTSAFSRWLASPAAGTVVPLPDWGGVGIRWFHNNYGTDFADTNNLSVVTFVEYAGFVVAFTGDIEAAGWSRLLLTQPEIRQYLAKVTVFVTSHHGRESGCSAEVCAICRPRLFVISDDAHQHETQQTVDWYRNRATGANVRRLPQAGGLLRRATPEVAERRVITTRADGSMNFSVGADGSWTCDLGLQHAS